MSGCLLVRGARQLLTLRGTSGPRRGDSLQDLEIIRDGALLIEDGRIIDVGPSRRVENLERARGAQEIDAAGRIVMPGFVDCHTQLVWPVPCPTSEETASDAHWNLLRNSSGKRLESRARHFINGMVRHGTTSLDSHCGYGLDQRTELKVLRVQARLDRTPADIASSYVNPPEIADAQECAPPQYLAWLCAEMLPAIRRKALARFVALRWDDFVFTPEQRGRYLEAARALGFELKIHDAGCSHSEALRFAVESGASSVDHIGEIADGDSELLAASTTIAVLLPGCTFHCTARGALAGRQIIDAGAAVALASGFSPGGYTTFSMQTVVALACAHLGMTAAEAICAATYNAAWAMRSADAIGSLETGKLADFLILNVADYHDLACHFGVNLVHRTVKRGMTVYQEGKVALH
jgi:imidazolonepropionase